LSLSLLLKDAILLIKCPSIGGLFFLLGSAPHELIGKDREVLIGEAVLTRYERARIVGARALQVSQGAPVLINVDEDEVVPIEVAKLELKARALPVGLQRRLPNNLFQNIPIQWLEDREFITQIRINDTQS